MTNDVLNKKMTLTNVNCIVVLIKKQIINKMIRAMPKANALNAASNINQNTQSFQNILT